MILELEISKPFQRRPGWYHSNVQRRAWWLWFAVALTKGDASARLERSWEDA